MLLIYGEIIEYPQSLNWILKKAVFQALDAISCVTLFKLTEINKNRPKIINEIDTVAIAINVIRLDLLRPVNVSFKKKQLHLY